MAVNIVEIDKNGRFISGITSDINGNYVLKVPMKKPGTGFVYRI
jgi:hypothetical protein